MIIEKYEWITKMNSNGQIQYVVARNHVKFSSRYLKYHSNPPLKATP